MLHTQHCRQTVVFNGRETTLTEGTRSQIVSRTGSRPLSLRGIPNICRLLDPPMLARMPGQWHPR